MTPSRWRDIFVIVLLESLITVGLGGLLGVVIALTPGVITAGVITAGVVASILGLERAPEPPLSAAGLGLAVTVLVGVLVGIMPARRPTTRSVIRAIRDRWSSVVSIDDALVRAAASARDWQMSLRDALVLRPAESAGCDVGFSADFATDRADESIRVMDPFAA